MRRTHWIPIAGGLLVAIALAIPAGLGDWSAAAIYGILFASIVTAAGLFALIDRDHRSARRYPGGHPHSTGP